MGIAWPAFLPPILVSPFIGSLIGVLAMRLPEGRPVGMARSECNGCGRTLGVADLVPVLSYLALRGRCRTCRAPIGRAHLLAEFAAIAIACVPALAEPQADPLRIWSVCALGWAALLLSWIDWQAMILPDVITLPLLVLGLLLCWFGDPDALGDHALASLLGYGLLRAVALAYRSLRGRDGMGAGDAKLLAAGGAWLGLQALPLMLFGGAVATLLLALVTGRTRGGDAVPFGPGLALAMWAVFLFN
ncbi:A24 family peptidase [Acetobacteraceae bacterium KSS8]|uniref:Prepilin leader peptidase/N-methyltransferase n=1 Tax=Endosaccharibacter trunci TaxID=2812733 RepID=A0ABT1WBM5_9PROT|nr:A24 family peptidase [Acetobacteraceae bacterium KSS8]